MNILILYRELAAYLIPSIEDIILNYNAKVTLVVYSSNPDAPYIFKEQMAVEIIHKSDWLLNRFDVNYDIVFCSGWADKDYLIYLSGLNKVVRKVICFDSEFKFNIRKILGILFLRFFVRAKFDFAFVPGLNSFRFARLIGFEADSIIKGVYSADVNAFNRNDIKTFNSTFYNRPFRFLYVGRYVNEKGIHDVCKAFEKYNSLIDVNSELWCVGTGIEKNNCSEHDSIKHLGFLQPSSLVSILDEVDIFIMPSHTEPWGVVLHEMVLAGLPVIVSDKVNSRELFLEHGHNGLEFRAGSAEDLFVKMISIVELYKYNCESMIQRSRQLGSLLMNDNWSNQIRKILS
jgi:glycosyltransferase involved in cell wall biosynthesis